MNCRSSFGCRCSRRKRHRLLPEGLTERRIPETGKGRVHQMHLRHLWRISILPLRSRRLRRKWLLLPLWESGAEALLKRCNDVWSKTLAESLMMIEALRPRLSVRLSRRVQLLELLMLRRKLLRQAREAGIG